jgi:hypothetical protein
MKKEMGKTAPKTGQKMSHSVNLITDYSEKLEL